MLTQHEHDVLAHVLGKSGVVEAMRQIALQARHVPRVEGVKGLAVLRRDPMQEGHVISLRGHGRHTCL